MIGAGRVAVVTGAASGIGRALAETFAAAGSAVVVADLDASEAEVVAAGIRAAGGDAEAVAVDVSDAAAVDRLAATTLERFGRVDVLCNNAGVSTFNLFRDQTLDDWRWVFGVNLWGVVHGVQTLRADHARAGHARATSSTPRRSPDCSAASPSSVRTAPPRSRWCRSRRRWRRSSRSTESPDRRERALPELGRHQGDGVGARAARGAGGRAPHRDGGVGAPHDPRLVHRADRSDPAAGRRRACSTPSATASSGSSPTATSRRRWRPVSTGSSPASPPKGPDRGVGLRDRPRVRGAAASGCARSSTPS